jgi:hypothetical protein
MPVALLEQLIKEGDGWVVENAVSNPNLSAEFLRQLVDSD